MNAPDTATPATPALTVRVPVYDGWWQVPDGLLSKGQLGELEFPRQPAETPAGRVRSADFRGRRGRLLVDLYRPERCPPTTASAAQLQAAAARSTRGRTCADCGAHPERSLDVVAGRALCHVCWHIQRLRDAQADAAAAQRHAADRAAEALAVPDAAVLHTSCRVPPPTPSGKPRPTLSIRIRAVDATTGRHLLDVTVSRTGPRARLRDPDAVPAADVAEQILTALAGRALICWDRSDVYRLHLVTPDIDLRTPRVIEVASMSTSWRAELTTRGDRIVARDPGTADRLLLHLRRITVTATGEYTGQQ